MWRVDLFRISAQCIHLKMGTLPYLPSYEMQSLFPHNLLGRVRGFSHTCYTTAVSGNLGFQLMDVLCHASGMILCCFSLLCSSVVFVSFFMLAPPPMLFSLGPGRALDPRPGELSPPSKGRHLGFLVLEP